MNTVALFGSFLFFSLFVDRGAAVLPGKYTTQKKCRSLLISKAKVRLRNRGRLAKVTCTTGYQLLGEKFVFCEEGRWADPLPTCIRGGCPSMKSLVMNAHFIESYSGALVEVTCDDGYTMTGNPILSCNGVNWNDTTPSCYLDKKIIQKTCDFESDDTCDWMNDFSDNFDWKIHSMATPSGSAGTGPEFDHSLGAGLNGKYLYIEASNRNAGDVARLVSPRYPPLEENSTNCFSFWYHMYGGHIGSLNVYVGQDLAFSESGNHGNRWIKAVIPVNHTSYPFYITIDGVRGNGYAGDIAIDDLKLSEGSDCDEQKNDTEVVLTGSCLGRCYENMSLVVNSCYCHDECHVNSSCCSDFFEICGLANLSTTGTEFQTIYANNSTTLLPFQSNITTSSSSVFINITNLWKSEARTGSITTITPDLIHTIDPNKSFFNNFTTSSTYQNSNSDYYVSKTLNDTYLGKNFPRNFNSSDTDSTVTNNIAEQFSKVTTVFPTSSPSTISNIETSTQNLLTTKKAIVTLNPLLISTVSSISNHSFTSISILPEVYNFSIRISNTPLFNTASNQNVTDSINLQNTSTVKLFTELDKNLSSTPSISDNPNEENYTLANSFDRATTNRFITNNRNETNTNQNQNFADVPTSRPLDTSEKSDSHLNKAYHFITTGEHTFSTTSEVNESANIKTQAFTSTTVIGNIPLTLLGDKFSTTTPKTNDKELEAVSEVTKIDNVFKSNSISRIISSTESPLTSVHFSSIPKNSVDYVTKDITLSPKKILPILEFITPSPPIIYRTPVFTVKSNLTGPKLNWVYLFQTTSNPYKKINNSNSLATLPSLKFNYDNSTNKIVRTIVFAKPSTTLSSIRLFTNPATSVFNTAQIHSSNSSTVRSNLFTEIFQTTNKEKAMTNLNSVTNAPFIKVNLNETIDFEKSTLKSSTIYGLTTVFIKNNFTSKNVLNVQTTTSLPPVKISSTIGKSKANFNNVLFNKKSTSAFLFYPVTNSTTLRPTLLSTKILGVSSSRQNKNFSDGNILIKSTPPSVPIASTPAKKFVYYDPKSKVINNNINIIPNNRIKISYNIPTRLNFLTTTTKTTVMKKASVNKIIPIQSYPTIQNPLYNNNKMTTAQNKMKELYDNYWKQNMPSIDYSNSWRLKYLNKGNQASYYKEETRIFTPSSIIGIILGTLTLGVIICTVVFFIRKKNMNRNGNDDDSDVQFFTSDELINFNLARPSPDRERSEPASKPQRPKRSVPQDCIRLVEQ